MKFPKSLPQSSKKCELAPGSFFCSGPTGNLLDSRAAAPGKHFAPLPWGDSGSRFTLEFLRILRISLEIMFCTTWGLRPLSSKKYEQRNAAAQQQKPQLRFAPKIIKNRLVCLENELFEYNKWFPKNTNNGHIIYSISPVWTYACRIFKV